MNNIENNNQDNYNDAGIPKQTILKFGKDRRNTLIVNHDDNEFIIKNKDDIVVARYKNDPNSTHPHNGMLMVDTINKDGDTICTTYNNPDDDGATFKTIFYDIENKEQPRLPICRYI